MLSMLILGKPHPEAKALLHHGMRSSRSDVRCSRNAVDITPTPTDVETDLLEAEKYGKNSFDEFIRERLIDKTKSFNDPIKKQNLKNVCFCS